MSPQHSTPNHNNNMIHAELSSEARATLHRMRRNSTISSIVIAFLTVALLLIILGYFGIKTFLEIPEDQTQYIEPKIVEPTHCEPIRRFSTQKPTAPSASSMNLLYVNGISPLTIPVPDIEVMEPSTEMGVGDDFGSGWSGDGIGTGFGGGSGSGFGSNSPHAKGLRGTLVDFKKKPSGSAVKKYDVKNPEHFVEPLIRLQRADFSSSSLRRHYQAPQQLVLNHLAVGFADANAGPKNFGAEKEILPSGWLAHYSGVVTVLRSGTYRFHGHGDDYLAVSINGKERLHAHWPDIQSRLAGDWKGTETTYKGPFQARMMTGDWFTVKQGDRIDVSIAIGERPGGKVGFVLQIEEQGQTYSNDALGRPILPLFQLSPINEEEKARIVKEFGNYRFEWENVPYFPIAP